jgi:hypothetical protein
MVAPIPLELYVAVIASGTQACGYRTETIDASSAVRFHAKSRKPWCTLPLMREAMHCFYRKDLHAHK